MLVESIAGIHGACHGINRRLSPNDLVVGVAEASFRHWIHPLRASLRLLRLCSPTGRLFALGDDGKMRVRGNYGRKYCRMVVVGRRKYVSESSPGSGEKES